MARGQGRAEMASGFRAVLRGLATEYEEESADRKHLNDWMATPDAEKLWQKLQDTAQARNPDNPLYSSDVFARLFVRDCLAARSISDGIEKRWRDRDTYLKRAEQAEDLASFFDALPSPSPVPNLSASLRNAAAILRSFVGPRNRRGTMRISRKNIDGSRARVAFMNWMSQEMERICAQPFDDVVARLTDIAFPRSEQTTTLDQVKSARTATTRASRSRGSTQKR
jgi:hypothetical protein